MLHVRMQLGIAITVYLSFLSAALSQGSVRHYIYLTTTHFQIGGAALTSSACVNECYGLLNVTFYVIGTPVSLDATGITGPPDCDAQASTLGSGYTTNGTTSFIISYAQHKFEFDGDGIDPNGSSTLDARLTMGLHNLAYYNNLTIACLSQASTVVGGYTSVDPCFNIEGSVTLSSPVTFINQPVITPSITGSQEDYYMDARLRSVVGIPTCELTVPLNASPIPISTSAMSLGQCDRCYGQFAFSAVVIAVGFKVATTILDNNTITERIDSSETTITTTQSYAAYTFLPNGLITGGASDGEIVNPESLYITDDTPSSGSIGTMFVEQSLLYTIIGGEYTSVQEVSTLGICVYVSRTIQISSVATFHSGDLQFGTISMQSQPGVLH